MSALVGRTLLAVTVYNGRAFTPRALASAARLISPACDVVVLDDCSPEPGWSEELAALCATFGIGYYRSPRNLGIPRNFNLALLLCEAGGYDGVIIANSDVIFPANLIETMAGAAAAESTLPIASVTAWSNNASIYSVPNEDPHRFLADEPTVDWVSSRLAGHFGLSVVPVPVGMGFCLLVRRDAIAAVGLFDPVFGRGYCEEVDWCRRAVDRGWVNVLTPACFVYHMGSASTREAGLLRPGEQTVHVNEDIVDRRHPDYRAAVSAWETTAGFQAVIDEALGTLVKAAATERGYVLEATWLPRARAGEVLAAPSLGSGPSGAVSGGSASGSERLPDPGVVRFEVAPDGGTDSLVSAIVDGFRVSICGSEPPAGTGVLDAVGAFIGVPPREVRIHSAGSVADRLRRDAALAGVPLRNLARYPELV